VELFYSLRYPTNIRSTAPHHPLPTILSVYGGPRVQFCANQWSHTASLREQFYADHGYLIVRVDNRGSDRRGHSFEAAIYEHLGGIEVEDYVSVLEHLIGQGIVDRSRIAIFGWSYGGYISLMAMAKAPQIFRCAISGAPVTAWDGYDTYYTGKPSDR
jgi:dipeptidyl-peptidase 4